MSQQCFHRWSATGRCVAPGCRASRPVDQEGGLPHPFAISDDRAQRIRELLDQGLSVRAVCRELGVASQTVVRVRDA